MKHRIFLLLILFVYVTTLFSQNMRIDSVLSFYDKVEKLDAHFYEVEKNNDYYDIIEHLDSFQVRKYRLNRVFMMGSNMQYIHRIVQQEEKYALLNHEMKWLIPLQDSLTLTFSDAENVWTIKNYLYVKLFKKGSNKVGLYNVVTQKQVFLPIYDEIKNLDYFDNYEGNVDNEDNTLFKLKKDGLYGMYSAKGDKLLPFEYDDISYVEPNVVAIKGDKKYYFDILGNPR